MDLLSREQLLKIIEEKNKLLVQKTMTIMEKDAAIKHGERMLEISEDQLAQLNIINQLRTTELIQYQDIVAKISKENNQLVQELANLRRTNKCLEKIVKLSESTSLSLMHECEKRIKIIANLELKKSQSKVHSLRKPGRLPTIYECPKSQPQNITSIRENPTTKPNQTISIKSKISPLKKSFKIHHNSFNMDNITNSTHKRIQTLIERNLQRKPNLRSSYSIEFQNLELNVDFIRYGKLPNIETANVNNQFEAAKNSSRSF